MNNLIQRLVIFLIRKKLGLKKDEAFKFSNQRSKYDFYYFTDTYLAKAVNGLDLEHSTVSLNWLLGDGCKIKKVAAPIIATDEHGIDYVIRIEDSKLHTHIYLGGIGT